MLEKIPLYSSKCNQLSWHGLPKLFICYNHRCKHNTIQAWNLICLPIWSSYCCCLVDTLDWSSCKADSSSRFCCLSLFISTLFRATSSWKWKSWLFVVDGSEWKSSSTGEVTPPSPWNIEYREIAIHWLFLLVYFEFGVVFSIFLNLICFHNSNYN